MSEERTLGCDGCRGGTGAWPCARAGRDQPYEFEPGVLPPNRYRREWKPSPISTALLIGGGVLFALFMVGQIVRYVVQHWPAGHGGG